MRGKKRKVNQKGVLLLAIMALVAIVCLQLIEEGGDSAVSSRSSFTGGAGEMTSADRAGASVKRTWNELFGGGHQDGEGNEVEELLEQANAAETLSEFVDVIQGDDDSPIVMTYASASYKDTVVNWLLSLKRVNVKSVGIVCLDDELQLFLRDRGIPCYLIDAAKLQQENNDDDVINGRDEDDAEDIVNSDKDIDDDDDDDNDNFDIRSESARARTRNKKKIAEQMNRRKRRDNLKRPQDRKSNAAMNVKKIGKLWILRMTHLLELLESGTNVIISDADAIWVQNAIANGVLSERTGDIVVSRGQFPFELKEQWGATACMGLGYFRATQNVINLLKLARREAVNAADDQVGVNRALFQSYGIDPVSVFGKKIELYGDEDEVAPGSEILPRLVLLAHTAVPRFCNRLSRRNWNKDVQVAHCHARDGQVAKTYKNWGNAKNRKSVMVKYDLWCSDVASSPNSPLSFLSWLERKSVSCNFLKFKK